MAIFSIFSVCLIIVFCQSYVLYVSYPYGTTLTKTDRARQVELYPTQNENQSINWMQLQQAPQQHINLDAQIHSMQFLDFLVIGLLYQNIQYWNKLFILCPMCTRVVRTQVCIEILLYLCTISRYANHLAINLAIIVPLSLTKNLF